MDYTEALAITGSTNSATGLRNTGAYYWLASSYTGSLYKTMWHVTHNGGIGYTISPCLGIRPIVTMADGVYVKSGSGTEADPYILGKD